VMRDWVEVLFGSHPDGGDGSLEWIILGALFLSAALFIVFAHTELRRSELQDHRPRPATSSSPS
jgi:hypothetical protein